MYVEEVKGTSRREAKLIKVWGEIENSVSIPAVKSMRDFFAHRWRISYDGEGTMKLPTRKKMGVYTWCTPWLCLWITGGSLLSPIPCVLNMSPHPRLWEPDCVCWHHFPHSQGGSDGRTADPAWAPLWQRAALNCSWLTANTNTHQPLNRELWWGPLEAGLQQEKQEILFFSEKKPTKGYMQQK